MKKIKKVLLAISLVMIISSIVILFMIKSHLLVNEEDISSDVIEATLSSEEEDVKDIPNMVFVDIKGAVKNPGVYEIEDYKKVIDVINLAGGFTEVADTSMINLAKNVVNEMVVIIYTKDEVKKATEPNQIIKYIDKECICPNIKNDGCINNSTKKEESQSSNKVESVIENNKLVNLNTATLEELQTLSGVGKSKAEAIIQYRDEKGGFSNIEELKEVSGIGEALFEKIKDYITV